MHTGMLHINKRRVHIDRSNGRSFYSATLAAARAELDAALIDVLTDEQAAKYAAIEAAYRAADSYRVVSDDAAELSSAED